MATSEADSGTAALALLGAAGSVDLVISDVSMPEMDGTVLATKVRAIRSGPPVILLSSVGERLPDGVPVAGNLIKPVKPAALRDLVASVFGVGAGSTAVRTQAAPLSRADLADRFPLRILLAEDNAVNQKLAVRLLQRMGYDPTVAGDGHAAIAALDRDDFDVVLMDVQMPELDGLDATRQIRARWPDRPLRIVAMTANAMAEDRDACLAAGMDDYVSKPIRVDELVAALERAAGRSGGTA
jgi:CheY-like chemotaxis protein